MLTLSSVRRGGALVAATALALSVVATGGAAQATPATHGGHWLADQLTHGLVHNDQFDIDDIGLTIDTAFALQVLGGHGAQVHEIRRSVSQDFAGYIGTGGEAYAGARAKLLVFAQATGGDPTSFGGVNLVKKLAGLVTKKGPAKGRIADRSQFGDYANTVGQVLAVRGLTAAKSGQAGKAERFLLAQQCRQGYFRLDFAKKLTAAHQGCRASSPADPDTTSYAVIELWKTSKGDPRLRAALTKAVTWLAHQQKKNGSFAGGTSTAASNANSTGLAGWALELTGSCHAAKEAASWVAGLQVGAEPTGSKLAGQRGAIAYDKAALNAGHQDGITTQTQDQWRRATSQAAPVLAFRSGC